MSKPLFIYLLSDPRDGQPRYVGKTDRSIAERYKEHKAEVKKLIYEDVSNPAKVRWLHDLKTLGTEAIVEQIDEDKFENKIKEDFWISFYLNSGCNLLNIVVPVDTNIPYPAEGADVPVRFRRTTVQLRSKDNHVRKESKFDQGKTEHLTKIYILTDPFTLKDKFIGATDLDLDDEYNRIRCKMYSRNPPPVGQWWSKLFTEQDERPIMRQVEQIVHEEAYHAVEYFIEHHALRGDDLEICELHNSRGRVIAKSSQQENAHELALLKVIRKKEYHGITLRELSRTGPGKHPKSVMDKILGRLQEEKKILFISIKTAGRPREVYIHSDFKEVAEIE